MATSLTRFEIVLPQSYYGTAQAAAVNQFLQSMLTLCSLVMYTSYIYPQSTDGTFSNQQNCLYGLVTPPQQQQAIGFLNTLNAALGSNVPCTTSQVQQEP